MIALAGIWKNRLLCVGLPVVFFMALALYAFPDFEIFWDEYFENLMARDNVALFLSYLRGEPVDDPYQRIFFNLEYYGTFFNLLAYAVQNLLAPDAPVLSFVRLEIKRYLIFVFAFAGAGAVGWAVYEATRSRLSLWLALGITALTPFYVQHAFTNPKDVPFAVMLVLFNVIAACDIVQKERRAGWAVALGVVAGLCASVRLVGLVVLAFWVIAWMICIQPAHWRRFALHACIAGVVAVLIVWVLHPVAYFQPFDWVADTMRIMAGFPHKTHTLTDGEMIYSLETPWYFLPKWLFVKTPLVWQLLCGVGIVHALASWRGQALRVRALTVLFLLQLTVIPLVAVIREINLYHMGRQFLFIYPAMTYFCAIAIVWMTRLATRYRWPALALTALLTMKTAWDIALLHPYHEAYFIEPVRESLQGWQYFTHMKEGAQWVAANASPRASVVIDTDRRRVRDFASFYAAPEQKVFYLKDKRRPRPFYFVSFGYRALPEGHIAADCELRYKATRPLGSGYLVFSSVRYCP